MGCMTLMRSGDGRVRGRRCGPGILPGGGAALGELLGNSEDGDRLWFLNGQPISVSFLFPLSFLPLCIIFLPYSRPMVGLKLRQPTGYVLRKMTLGPI